MSEGATLTNDEVEALMGGIDAQAAAAAVGAQSYTFGAEPARPLAAIPALHRMSERAARKLREKIEPISRLKPRVAADQWYAGPHVPRNQLQPGDLVFFANNVNDPATIHHVGIYVGGGAMIGR